MKAPVSVLHSWCNFFMRQITPFTGPVIAFAPLVQTAMRWSHLRSFLVKKVSKVLNISSPLVVSIAWHNSRSSCTDSSETYRTNTRRTARPAMYVDSSSWMVKPTGLFYVILNTVSQFSAISLIQRDTVSFDRCMVWKSCYASLLTYRKSHLSCMVSIKILQSYEHQP